MKNSVSKASALAILLVLVTNSCEKVKVTSPDVTSISISSSATSVSVGSTISLQATLTDSQGRVLDREIQWTVSGPQLQVTGSGRSVTVRGVSVGSVTVTAESEGVSSAALTVNVVNVPATITSIAPTSATAGSAAITLTVTGRDFVNGSTVAFNGIERTTNFVSATQLTASIPASDLATGGTFPVSVRNPAPGGGASGNLDFTVNNRTPLVTSVSPSTVVVNSGSFTLTVTGVDFVSGATVRWNGSNRATTFVSSTSLRATILATDVANSGTAAIQVANPPPVAAASNTVSLTISSPAPDLVVSQLTAPSTGTVGATIPVSMTVTNDGTLPAGAFRVGFYYSTDATITTSDTPSGSSCTFTGLGAGGSAVCNPSIQIPGLLAVGTYFVGAIADDQGAVTEASETNNARASSAITLSTPPDLIMTQLIPPSSGLIGDFLNITMTVRNQGGSAAGEFEIRTYYSTDATISTSDVWSGNGCVVPSLGAGATYTCGPGNIQVPGTLAPGTYYVGAIADALGAVSESNENNNTYASPTTTVLTPKPDLTITGLTAPTGGTIGGTIQVTMTLANQGGNVGAFRVGFYFSSDQTITTSDFFSSTVCDFTNGIPAGGNSGCTAVPVRVPSSLAPGNWYLGVIADDLGQISETLENNNTRAAGPITMMSDFMQVLIDEGGRWTYATLGGGVVSEDSGLGTEETTSIVVTPPR